MQYVRQTGAFYVIFKTFFSNLKFLYATCLYNILMQILYNMKYIYFINIFILRCVWCVLNFLKFLSTTCFYFHWCFLSYQMCYIFRKVLSIENTWMNNDIQILFVIKTNCLAFRVAIYRWIEHVCKCQW